MQSLPSAAMFSGSFSVTAANKFPQKGPSEYIVVTTPATRHHSPARVTDIHHRPYSFYPRDAMHSAVFARATCPSGCPSVTVGIVSKRRELTSWFLHHLIAPWLHSLASYDSSKNSQGVALSEGNLWEWGGFERAIFANFRPISRRISETAQDTTKVTIEH